MRLCNQCHRLTAGEPLFCIHCGRTYDLKLCSSRHPNPRNAEVCGQCGSRDLSTPQPRSPFWLAPVASVLSLLPGVVLWLLTVIFFFGLLQGLISDPQLQSQFLGVGLMLGLLWFVYLQLPSFLRNLIKKIFGTSKKDDHRHDH